jgi:uncharacterized protein (TIGR03067 family)
MKRYSLQVLLGIAMLITLRGSLTFADDGKEAAIKKARKQFEGTWQVVSLQVDGNTVAEEDAKKIMVVNEADGKWAIEVEGKIVVRGTSMIDPTKKPGTVDLTTTEGDDPGKISLGVYEFKDDTRKVCYAGPDMERPTEFTSQSGSKNILAVLKRVKK